MLHINHLCYFFMMPLFPCFRALVQLLWISFVKEPLWLFTCSAAPSPKQPTIRGLEGNQQTEYSAAQALIHVFWLDDLTFTWGNSSSFPSTEFSNLLFANQQVFTVAFFPTHFIWYWNSHSMNLQHILMYPTHKAIVGSSAEATYFFFQYASSNTSSLYSTTELPHFQFSC